MPRSLQVFDVLAESYLAVCYHLFILPGVLPYSFLSVQLLNSLCPEGNFLVPNSPLTIEGLYHVNKMLSRYLLLGFPDFNTC